jgi:hypothetical protein
LPDGRMNSDTKLRKPLRIIVRDHTLANHYIANVNGCQSDSGQS